MVDGHAGAVVSELERVDASAARDVLSQPVPSTTL